MEIRSAGVEDRPWVRQVVSEAFASPRIISRGVLHVADNLPGFVAEEAGKPAGLLLYDVSVGECAVVVVISLRAHSGVATALLAEAGRWSRVSSAMAGDHERQSARVAFYRKLGWRQVAIHRGAAAEARRLKPEIPKFGTNGLLEQDEIEFDLMLG